MLYALAALPFVIVLALMLLLRWGGQRAGPAGLAVGLLVALLAFGLNWQVLWVSQAKGLLLSIYVLIVLWSALLLYNIVNQSGGIRAIAQWLQAMIQDRGILVVVLAWAFSAVLEGLAGFGLPIAIVAPMLAALGVAPVAAVAAVAVGHAWSVTFGDMGVIFQTLTAVVKLDAAYLAPAAVVMLGLACIACGIGAARLLGQASRWKQVVIIGALMALAQGVLVLAGVPALGAFGAGFMGVVCGILLSRRINSAVSVTAPSTALLGAFVCYGGLAALMTLLALIQPLREWLGQVLWQAQFPEVVTQTGHATPSGAGQSFRILLHPGSAILLTALLSYPFLRKLGTLSSGSFYQALGATWRAAAPSSVGIISMVGLAALMEHCGMTQLLAQGIAQVMGGVFPLASPLIGILGAFATGSNTNSNVLFGVLQKDAASLLGIDARIVLAAQTAGGSLGSMIAPAKIIVGCSTLGMQGRDGDVLRKTLPYGLGIGLLLGVVALVWSWFTR